MALNSGTSGQILELTAPAGGVTSGEHVLIGTAFGVPVASATAGAAFALRVQGIEESVAKRAGVTFAEGDAVYWDDVNSRCDTDSTLQLIGTAVDAAGGTATTMSVRLSGQAIDAATVGAGAAGDVALNTTHRTSAGTDHADVVLNNTHRTSAGTDHADVVLNNTHRGRTDNPHSVTLAQASLAPVVVNTATLEITAAAHAARVLHVTRTATGACLLTVASAAIADDTLSFDVKDAGLNAGTHNITIATEGAETIDGSATLVVNSDGAAFRLYSDGSNLFIL